MSGTDGSSPSLTSAGQGSFAVTGPVSFATAGPLLEASRGVFAGTDAVTVNLSGVTRVDSAGLALLLEWLRQARSERRAIQFTALPDKLLAIARLSGVDGLLQDGYPASSTSASSGSASSRSASSR